MPTPRKSEELHELQGTKPQYKTGKTAESYLPPSRPRYPKGFDRSARKLFKGLCGLLEDRRVLTSGDFEAIRMHVILHERLARAQEHLNTEGEICTYTKLDKDGAQFLYNAPNLWLKVAISCERQMLAILVQLGLTPKAKDHVRPTKSPVVQEVNFEDAYFNTKRKPSVVPSVITIRPEEMLASDEEPEHEQDDPQAE